MDVAAKDLQRAHYRALAEAAMFRTWAKTQPVKGHRAYIEPMGGRRG